MNTTGLLPIEGPEGREEIESYGWDDERGVLVRHVNLRDRGEVESQVLSDGTGRVGDYDVRAAYDRAWLQLEVTPSRTEDRGEIRVADLFSGCGGMTLGLAESCRALGLKMVPVLAVDTDPAALEVFKHNFPAADARTLGVEELLDGKLGCGLTDREKKARAEFGKVDVVLAGPPCQGNSDLNNHTRREDPKNALYSRVARAAEVFRPEHLIVENVLGIRHDRNRVFQVTRDFLRNHIQGHGYSVDTAIIHSEEVGVAQYRHRVFLVASRSREVDIERFLQPFRTALRDFVWACGDLTATSDNGSRFDAASTPRAVTKKRIDYLFDNELHDLPDDLRPPCHRDKDHSYRSVYGRMWENRPSPTITTGFTVMGQGRFVHPTRRRTITPHEAARLQFFPDFFDFGQQSRSVYKKLIGNAVPPKLVYVLALQLLR